MVAIKKKKSPVKKRSVKQKKTVYTHFYGGKILFKLLIVLILFYSSYIVYDNWKSWLESLDQTPLRSYALNTSLQFTTDTDIREALSKLPNLKGYFGQNIEEIEQALRRLPWVKSVIVRKIWPDRFVISLYEHKPIAVWNDIHLLSDQGAIFNLPLNRIDKTRLPILFGPDPEAKEVLNVWNRINEELKQRKLVLKSVSVDKRGSWDITLSNDIVLKLGRGEWSEKIERFMVIFPQINVPENKRVAYVDLRYNYGGAVGFIEK